MKEEEEAAARCSPNSQLSEEAIFTPNITNARAIWRGAKLPVAASLHPKKAQNAHGGVRDCKPSLKVQSCLCSAMKKPFCSPSPSPASGRLAGWLAGGHFIDGAEARQTSMI